MNQHKKPHFPYGARLLPYQPCVACGAGDASRAVVIAGEPIWLAAGLDVLAGVEESTARQMVVDVWDDLGEYADGRRSMAVRLCRDCARRATDQVPGIHVYSATRIRRGESVHALRQPEEASHAS
jgi:hypothetical protein